MRNGLLNAARNGSEPAWSPCSCLVTTEPCRAAEAAAMRLALASQPTATATTPRSLATQISRQNCALPSRGYAWVDAGCADRSRTGRPNKRADGLDVEPPDAPDVDVGDARAAAHPTDGGAGHVERPPFEDAMRTIGLPARRASRALVCCSRVRRHVRGRAGPRGGL